MPFWSGSTDTSRPPPPSDPPPRYAQVMRKVYPYSLRPIVIFTAILGGIWAIVMGVDEIRDMGSDNETQRLRTFSLVIAILYFVCAGAEVLLVAIAIMQKVTLGRWIKIIAPAGFLAVFAAQIMAVVRHFALRGELISQCTANTVGQEGWTSSGVRITFNQEQAQRSCTNAWERRNWAVIAWLIVSLILATIFVSAALGYHRQLLDPNSVRTRTRNQPEAYAMQPNNYSNYPPPPPQQEQQGWMVPPYPGPPAGGMPGGSQGYEKGDYQPSAEWANRSYGAPPGSSPGVDRTPDQMQDDAWARAQASGPTAHLTGGGAGNSSPVGGSGATSERREVIRNDEEDEAWDQARREGVTAHLTGTGAAGAGAGAGTTRRD